jgi:hypothetical protein
MDNVVDFKAAALRIRDHHRPGKLVGLVRSLRKAHTHATVAKQVSVSLLTANILGKMVGHGSKMWWDIVDVNLHPAMLKLFPESDSLGIRTLAGQVELGRPSDDFIYCHAHREVTMPYFEGAWLDVGPKDLTALIVSGADKFGLVSGGVMPMLQRVEEAIVETGLSIRAVRAQSGKVLAVLADPEENHRPDAFERTWYMVTVNLEVLNNDIEIIRSSLARSN